MGGHERDIQTIAVCSIRIGCIDLLAIRPLMYVHRPFVI